MRKVILHINMSVDGFTAGPTGELDWVVIDPESWGDIVTKLHDTDTVLLGRLNYEGFYGYWPHVATYPHSTPIDIEYSRWLDATPKVVFSRTLEKTDWKNSRLAQKDTATEIAQLKQQSGKDIVIMNSTTLAQSLMQLDLIDEFWLTVHPAVVGNGKQLFDGTKEKLPLKLLESKSYPTGPIYLHYARVRE